jgi:hypothetical protein
MMHGHGKSDSPIVLAKLPNKAACAAAEAVEGRGLFKTLRLGLVIRSLFVITYCPYRILPPTSRG